MVRLCAILLVAALVYESDGSIANFIADETLVKISKWMQTEGPKWFTVPGSFQHGQMNPTAEEFTVAYPGPNFALAESMIRSGEASLDQSTPDPDYDSSQKLTFSANLLSAALHYNSLSYFDERLGFYNLKSTVTTSGLQVTVVIDVKGSGDSCWSFANSVAVTFNGTMDVTIAGQNSQFPTVIESLTQHFNTYVPKALEGLTLAATFSSLEGYDICSGIYDPFPRADFMANRIIGAITNGFATNITAWGSVPGFTIDSTTSEGSVIRITAKDGIFSSAKNIQRVGESSYFTNEGKYQWTTFYMQLGIGNLIALFKSISYSDGQDEYQLAETIEFQKFVTSLTITFFTADGSKSPLCSSPSVGATTKYEGDSTQIENLTPDIPASVLNEVDTVLNAQVLKFGLNGATSGLIIRAVENYLSLMCA